MTDYPQVSGAGGIHGLEANSVEVRNIGRLIELTSSDSSITITGNNTTKTMDFAVSSSVLWPISAGTNSNETMILADTEYSHVFPVGMRFFVLQNRNNGLIKLAFVSGQSGTNYWTIFPGQQFCGDNFDGSSITVYFQSPSAAQVLEIVTWS